MVCCAYGCKNSHTNSAFEFYKFPGHKYKENQKKQWITAVQRNHPDGSKWVLKPHHLICSEHFVGNKRSDSFLSPSYIPTVFSFKSRDKIKEKNAVNRHERFLKRRMADQTNKFKVKEARLINLEKQQQVKNFNENLNLQDNEKSGFYESAIENKTVDQECQVEIVDLNNSETTNSFTCVRYIYNDKDCCDVEIQTDLTSLNNVEILRKKVKNQYVGTASKSDCDREVTCDLEKEEKKFCGYQSILNEKQLKHTAGVTIENFQFLLKRARSAVSEYRCTVSLENRLFIFLIIMKTGLTFSTLSVFFCVHEATISRIFFSMLHHLSSVTSNLVFWPDKYMVQSTMPECFKPDYMRILEL